VGFTFFGVLLNHGSQQAGEFIIVHLRRVLGEGLPTVLHWRALSIERGQGLVRYKTSVAHAQRAANSLRDFGVAHDLFSV